MKKILKYVVILFMGLTMIQTFAFNEALGMIILPPPPEKGPLDVGDMIGPTTIWHWETPRLEWYVTSGYEPDDYTVSINNIEKETGNWVNGEKICFNYIPTSSDEDHYESIKIEVNDIKPSTVIKTSAIQVLKDEDTDGDGLWDHFEEAIGGNPDNNDTDDDGLTDFEEYYTYHTYIWNPDSDGDGLPDGTEVNDHLTNPLIYDTDGDGINDYLELEIFTTNPNGIDYNPSDPYFYQQYNYLDDINIFSVWDVLNGSSSSLSTIKVAVIDVGYDTEHEDWGNNMDSSHEKDYTTDSVGTSATCNSTGEGNYHGTSISGLIVAEHNNVGIAGIAGLKDVVQLINYRVAYDENDSWTNPSSNGIYVAVSNAIRQAVTDGCKIISMSFMINYDQDIKNACIYAAEHGVLLIASAGNYNRNLDEEDQNHYPSDYEQVMAVGSIDYNHQQADWGCEVCKSNYGNNSIDILAPGVDIFTTSHHTHINGYCGFPGYTFDFGMTSSSAPMVAAVAALLLSYDSSLTLDNLRNILTNSGLESSDPVHFGHTKMLNAAAAFSYAYYNYWILKG